MYTYESVKSELPYYQEMILFYKVNPCISSHIKVNCDLLPGTHDANQLLCFHYHTQSERRRKVFNGDSPTMLYQPVICPFVMRNSACSDEEGCKFSHNQAELSFHPLNYKIESCSGCAYESNPKYCHYYHSDENSRTNILEKFRQKTTKNTSISYQNHVNTDESASNLEKFKAKQCQIKGSHNPKVCEYYHHEKDRKRPVSVYHYNPHMCSYVERSEICPDGDNCMSCHNKVEQLYHPQRYKKKFCTEHPHNLQRCDYGNYCSFAHSEMEIQIELLHNMKKDTNFYLYKYKTVFCPYIYSHDRNQCVYAHNPQDYRRDPTKYNYSPIQCQNWSKKQIYTYEEGGCLDQMQCKQCHGWKELDYNPMYYKTETCSNIDKCAKRDCPFYHSETEKRKTNHINPTKIVKNPIIPGKENLDFPNLKNQIKGSTQTQSKGTKSKVNQSSSQMFRMNEITLRKSHPKETSTKISSSFPINIQENNYIPNDKKKRKFKKMSLQNQRENLVNSSMDRPKGLSVGNSGLVNENFVWKFIKSEERIYNDFKSFGSESSPNENEMNGSNGSLYSFTDEETKPSDIRDIQFTDNLLRNLEKKELEYETSNLQSRFAEIKLKSDVPKENDLDITFAAEENGQSHFDVSDIFQRSTC